MDDADAKPDFSGYATKANLRCSDGRTIMPAAFAHQDKAEVPLVWQHGHNSVDNILGYAVLEHREDGVYCYGYFNDTTAGQDAKKLVRHGDVKALSIFANRLTESSKKEVTHGMIREVSIVLAGANPGASIDNVNLEHADGSLEELDEAIISAGEDNTDLKRDGIAHSDEDDESDEGKGENLEHAAEGETLQDVFDSMSEPQQNVVYYMLARALNKGEAPKDMEHSFSDEEVQKNLLTLSHRQQELVGAMIGAAIEESENNNAEATADSDQQDGAAHADADTDAADAADDDKEGSTMAHNAFAGAETEKSGTTLSHSEIAAAHSEIFADARKNERKLSDSVEAYALKHGIEDIEVLFPDARAVTATPEFLKRRTEWVADVMTNTHHSPFSRIKSLSANLTLDEARAKGYIKGNLKKEEFFRVSKRITTPQTVYKKQQLDRDDILDISDFDVVAWLRGEMRLMLEEEIARAILVGDGREGDDQDKISEEHVRPIATDNDFYVTRLYVNLADAESSPEEIVDALTLQRRHYRGSGNPTFYTSETMLAQMLLVKDTLGRRIYQTPADLVAALRVSKIVTCEILDEPSVSTVGILVNLQDYNVGADRGGDVTMFDDFDIDYNQYKYLIETRISGALVKPKSALVVLRTVSNAVLVDPVAPTWNKTNHTVTPATTTGITYRNKLTNVAITSAQTLTPGDELLVIAVPASGYYLASNANDEFFYTYENGRADNAIL